MSRAKENAFLLLCSLAIFLAGLWIGMEGSYRWGIMEGRDLERQRICKKYSPIIGGAIECRERTER